MRYILIACVLLFNTVEANQIIYLISPPRSLSVAFMRMMEARGDFQIFNEPSQFAYVTAADRDYALTWFDPSSYQTFEEVKHAIFTAAKKTNVFVKEMSFAAEKFLLEDPLFIQNENIHFVFLMRNPHHTVMSFYNKSNQIFDLMTYFIGYEPLYNIYKKVKSEAKQKPIIILSEDLYSHPEETIQTLCSRLEIPYRPEALHWESLDHTFNAKEKWHELKTPQLTFHWHSDAMQSTHFGAPHNYKVNDHGEPTFEEIEDPIHREACIKAYEHNLFYYQLVLQESKPNSSYNY